MSSWAFRRHWPRRAPDSGALLLGTTPPPGAPRPASLLLSVSREKYPRSWFDFNLAYLRLHNRAITYLLLLRDEYPSSDEDQAVHLRWHNRVIG